MIDEDVKVDFRELRKRARLTMREAAKVSGVSESTICNVEKGTHRPQAKTFDALLETYRARIQYLRNAVA